MNLKVVSKKSWGKYIGPVIKIYSSLLRSKHEKNQTEATERIQIKLYICRRIFGGKELGNGSYLQN